VIWLNVWMKATKTTDKQHPKCEGEICGSWDICNACETAISYIGCVLYDEEAENKMIDDEIEAGL
jgi:hypothetical protein